MNWILTHIDEYSSGERENGVFTKIHAKINKTPEGFHWAVFKGRRVVTGTSNTIGEADSAVGAFGVDGRERLTQISIQEAFEALS